MIFIDDYRVMKKSNDEGGKPPSNSLTNSLLERAFQRRNDLFLPGQALLFVDGVVG
jgi:hypothetical protein